MRVDEVDEVDKRGKIPRAFINLINLINLIKQSEISAKQAGIFGKAVRAREPRLRTEMD